MPVKTKAEAPKFIVNRPDRRALERLLEARDLALPAVVIRLAWQLGLLRGEIHDLTWDRVDFTASELRLPDRTVPMEPEVQVFLQRLSVRHGGDGPVVRSDRGGTCPAEQHLSYVCRKALDSVGQKDVRLLDLRYDYILRQLEHHDRQYVSRISGLDLRTLRLHFEKDVGQPPAREEAKPAAVDAERVRAVLEAEGYNACGVALRLTWQLGLYQEELLNLTWDMVDLETATVTLPRGERKLPPDLASFLAELSRRNGAEGHVLLSDRARKPMEVAFLSRAARAALIRGGCAGLGLRDLRRDSELQNDAEEPVLRFLETHSRIMRADVARLLSVTADQANARLRRMVERGTLVLSGHCYYLPGVIVSPDQQRDAVLAYLATHPGCQRKDLARLLGLEPKQCLTVLEKLRQSGDLLRRGTRYYPA